MADGQEQKDKINDTYNQNPEKTYTGPKKFDKLKDLVSKGKIDDLISKENIADQYKQSGGQ